MSDLISRQDLKEKLNEICDTRCPYNEPTKAIGACCSSCFIDDVIEMVQQLPSAEPVIYCKDCKHKPRYRYPDDLIKNDGFDIIFPDSICPCQCDDGWYNWMPKDNFYCAYAERRTDE